MSIPRSTRTGRGQLSGPASSARQVKAITLRVEQPEPGVLRLSQPFGWVGGLARTPQQLAALVASAFCEAQVNAYSQWQGHVYDGTDPASPPAYRRPRPAHRGHRVDVHDPREWRLDGDGKWIAPGSGRRWRPDSQTVQRVQARRVGMGLSPTPDPATPAEGRTGALRGRAAG